jgi:predicted AAA+ superfamily ATPase
MILLFDEVEELPDMIAVLKKILQEAALIDFVQQGI